MTSQKYLPEPNHPPPDAVFNRFGQVIGLRRDLVKPQGEDDDMSDIAIDRAAVERVIHALNAIACDALNTDGWQDAAVDINKSRYTLRALLAARDADRARIKALEAEVERLRGIVDDMNCTTALAYALEDGAIWGYHGKLIADALAAQNAALAALRDTGGEGE